MRLQSQRVQTLEQVRRVAQGNVAVDFALADRGPAYEFIGRALVQFEDAALSKASKCAVEACLGWLSWLSRSQLTRLPAHYRSRRHVRGYRIAGRSRREVLHRG